MTRAPGTAAAAVPDEDPPDEDPVDAVGRAFGALPDAILVHEAGRIVHCNAAARRLLRDPASCLAGQRLEGLFQDGTVLDAAPDMAPQDVILSEGGQRASLWVLPPGPGGLGVAVLRAAPDPEWSRRHRKRADRDAQLARLEEMNRFKTRLLNTAAHELNTPLTPLRLQSHLLASGNLGKLQGRQKKAVDMLERNVKRLSMLVGDILDVARLESGHLKIEMRVVAVADLVQDAADAYEETARGLGIGLQIDVQEDIWVNADPRRILQVLYNLVSNALKFTPEGGTVWIKAYRDRRAWIEVRDTGIGMAREQIARIFQPFSRVHDPEKVGAAGTGLGLYISQGIVEGHHSTLRVRSDGPGQGASFRFDLALAEAAGPDVSPDIRSSPVVARPLARRLRELI